MTLILMVDDGFGLAFGARRQSRDRELVRDVVRLANGRKIFAREYSRLIFDEAGINNDTMTFCDEPTKAAGECDLVLLELAVKKSELDLAKKIIIYSWNRRYPATAKLDIDYIKANFELKEEFDFKGNSHDKLTRRVYERK